MNVSIIGTGYVGLTTGACLAFLGHRVTCVDTDERKVNALHQGKIPFYEPHMAELVAEARPNLCFTTQYGDAIPAAQVVFIAVGTPPGANGAPDLRYLEAAARSIGEHLPGEFVVVVNKSTVPIGSGNWVESIVRDAYELRHGRKANGAFGVASNPEFLREGSAILDSLYPDRIVVGADDPATLEAMRQLYAPLIEQRFPEPSFAPRPSHLQSGPKEIPVVETTITSAEMIKYSANTFLALKIGFANEMANICERVGA